MRDWGVGLRRGGMRFKEEKMMLEDLKSVALRGCCCSWISFFFRFMHA